MSQNPLRVVWWYSAVVSWSTVSGRASTSIGDQSKMGIVAPRAQRITVLVMGLPTKVTILIAFRVVANFFYCGFLTTCSETLGFTVDISTCVLPAS